jgi:outer membrane protein OmpA-like peptidoglycan-associated protein
MALPRPLAFLAVSIAAAAVVAHARAQDRAPLLTLGAAAGMAITEPQTERFGVGGAAAVAGYVPLAHWLLAGARLRAGLLANGDPPADPAQVDPSTGTFQTLSALLRVRPLSSASQPRNQVGLFVEAGVGGVLTGELFRAGLEGGIGWGIDFGKLELAPTLHYLQVVQPSDPLSDEDARVLMLGVEMALLDASPRRLAAAQPDAPVRGDTDGDGLRDDQDACPKEAEDKDGHQDADGCPESDNDGDNLKDPDDRCANEAEDTDAFEDEDGCPDPDNDHDGFSDFDDQCPAEAEVINGNKDYDGCPDEGLIEMRNDRIVLEEQVLFDFERARVKSAARPVLAAIASLHQQHPEWLKIRIEGHADARGNEEFNHELSRRRADNVRKELIKLGIPAELIESEGYGSSRPRDKRGEPRAYQRNRRVEIVVVSPKSAAPPGSSQTPAPQPPIPDPERGEP